MHSGFERPRGALQGVIAHQARANNPLPSHVFFAGRADLAAAVDVCALGRAVRGRSRGTGRAACGKAAVDRFGAADNASAVTRDSVPDASCASASTRSATGAIADGFCGANAGIGTTGAVATTLVSVAIAASSVESASPPCGNDGRSRVQAPQPRAAMPVNASEAATLR